jgi:hypothetical protein
MKQLFLILAIIVCCTSSILAQTYPCDISSGGLELRNSLGNSVVQSLQLSTAGNIKLNISNVGVDPTGCAYPAGTIDVVVEFYPPSSPNAVINYNGPATFTSGKFTFTWNAASRLLYGTNNQAMGGGLGNVQNVLVPVMATKLGSGIPYGMQLQTTYTSDDVTNNYKEVFVNVVPAVVLPVKLESIDGLSDKCNAQLKWSTSNETNLSKFEIEVSKNGVDFDRAGTIKPSSSNAGNYQFNTTQSSGKSYYRLKIIDRDGSFTYSKVVPISTSCSDKIVKVFPNPVKLDQLLNVNISGYDASVKGDLYSSTGQFVKSYVLKNGANNLSVENLAQGFYTLRVSENGSVTETFKLNVLQ